MIERRYQESEFELRGESGAGATLIGYAAVFDSPTVIAGMFTETIAPRAFRKTIKEADVRALFNHDPSLVLGRNKAGTLRLEEDKTGLHYEIDLPETQLARDLWTSIDRGDVSQSSFAFETVKEKVDYPDDGMPFRTLTEVRLYDVSPVTYPAYEDTSVSARAAAVMETWHVPDLREATTTEPEPDPQPQSEPTQEPERKPSIFYPCS